MVKVSVTVPVEFVVVLGYKNNACDILHPELYRLCKLIKRLQKVWPNFTDKTAEV